MVDAESTLNAFRPPNLLSNDAILEILHILVTGRDDAQIMDSQYLCSAVWEAEVGGNSDWGASTVMMFPLFEGSYSFLLSMDTRSRSITIHDNKTHDEIVRNLSAIATEHVWEFRYKWVSEVL